MCIPQTKIDSKRMITDLCSTVNELRKQIKALSISNISEEQLTKNLQSKDILLNEEMWLDIKTNEKWRKTNRNEFII